MDISFHCQCGAVRGVASDVDHAGSHRVLCYCDDCQAFLHWLGREDLMDAKGGTDIYAVPPSHLRVTQGLDKLKAVRLTGKGPYRWHASCCQTPIANSAPLAKLPFVGMFSSCFDVPRGLDKLGPVYAHLFPKFAKGPLPGGNQKKAPLKFYFWAGRFMLSGLLKKWNKSSPFFDNNGKPIVKPLKLTAEERAKLQPLCGPKRAIA